MNNPITIKILAKALSLSPGTISKALKDSYEISKETKEKVQALAKALNYVPNPYASSLRKKISNTIAVVLPEVADSLFSQAINGIESIAQDNGYHVLIYLTHESLAREETILEQFQSGRVDGILMSVSAETSHSEHIEKIIASGIPVVFFDRICENVETACVTTDDLESGYKAACHLLEQGCKKIAFLSISNKLAIINMRLEGFNKALKETGIKTGAVKICSNNEAECAKTIKKLLMSKNRPDGIIASAEKLAAAVYTVSSEINLGIPADIKVIAFSNLQIASLLNPPLSTITQPAFEIGRTAATLLFKSLEKSKFNLKDERIVIPSLLIKRASTVN